ncbi:MAG: hypothetical protein GX552_18740 [Chloroflexi bacterium]|jgi:hypothetical protein|nr:hypothetical protein [Chloroflexota bacterium]
MALEQVLIMAVTRMLSGFCVAGLTTERDPVSRLRWVRPVKAHGPIGERRQSGRGRAWC